MRKMAIFRTVTSSLDLSKYNVQEIGLAKGLLKQGISSDIYSRFTDVKNENIFKKFENNYIKLIPITGFTFKGRIVDFSLKRRIFDNNYDIVQVQEDSQIMTPFLLKWAKKKNATTVLYQGIYEKHSGYKAIIQKVYNKIFIKKINNNCNYYFAKTEAAQRYLINNGLNKNNHILPVGLDFDKKFHSYKDIERIKEFRSKFDYLLLYIGKIEKRRNTSFILDVLNISGEKNLGLLLVGQGPDMVNLVNKIGKLRLNSQVLIIKEIPNNQLKQIYELADLFLLPSLYEPFGMVLLESLYFSLPVIASKTAGPLDILKNEKLGICLELNPQLWTNYIKYYLEMKNYKDFRKRYIISNYNWNKIAKKYLNILFPGESEN